jgi:hypothetical protein
MRSNLSPPAAHTLEPTHRHRVLKLIYMCPHNLNAASAHDLAAEKGSHNAEDVSACEQQQSLQV